MDKLQEVRENEQLRTLLMTECDIYFYDKISEVQFFQGTIRNTLLPVRYLLKTVVGENMFFSKITA